MTAPLGDAWQLAGLMLFSDVDHYVKFDVVADNDPGAPKVRRVELRYENGGGLTGPGGQDIAPPASATDTWWLRLTKTGQHLHRRDLGERHGLGAGARLGDRRPEQPGDRPDGVRSRAGGADRRRLRVLQARRGRHGGSDDDAHAVAGRRFERLARDQPDAHAGHRGRRDDGVQGRRRRLDALHRSGGAGRLGDGLLPLDATRRATSRRPRPSRSRSTRRRRSRPRRRRPLRAPTAGSAARPRSR